MGPKILKGKLSIVEVNKGIGEYFFERADYFGDHPFQIDAETGVSQSFLEVRKRSVRAAIDLQKLNVQSTDVVIQFCDNNLDGVIPWFATIFVGAIGCAVDPKQDVNHINSILALTKPKVVYTIESMLKTVENGLNLANHVAEIIVLGKSDKYRQFNDIVEAESEEERNFKPVKANVKQTAFIFLSSGTTAAPKLIERNHYGFMQPVVKLPLPPLTNERSPILQRTNFSWTVGAWVTIKSCASGSPKLLISDLNAGKTLDYLSKYKVNYLATGSAYDIVDELERNPNHNYDLSHLKNIEIVANKINANTILKLRMLFPKCQVFQSYGSTEMSFVANFNQSIRDDPKALEKVDSVGVVNDNVELKIVDIYTREPLAAHQEGEILVKIPFGFNGYYKSKEPLPLDKDGFYKSQDIGYYDEDGYIYLTERLNDSFKTRIKNELCIVHPSVIEAVFLKHPNVNQVSVFNLTNPKSINDIAALVVLKDNSEDILNDLLDFVNKNILNENYKVTGGIKKVNELPKNIREKVPKRASRELFLKL